MNDLADSIRQGDRRGLARAITLVESTRDDHRRDSARLLDALLGVTPSDTIRIGVSGPPGVGKSTLIEAMGLLLLQRGHRVAVLAIDPTSQRTGGSILGDKTRMPKLASAAGAFVRPSPAGHSLGGVADSTAATITLVEAAGHDIVLVETVGIGQSETAVAEMTDVFLLLQGPGGGDELQGIKRGVMELADVVAVTKADGDLLAAAQRAAAELSSALHLLRPRPGRQPTRVLLCSAQSDRGVIELVDHLMDRHAAHASPGQTQTDRSRQAVGQMWTAVREEISRRVLEQSSTMSQLGDLEAKVAELAVSPRSAAFSMLDILETGTSA